MQEAIRRVESQLAGDSSRVGEASSSGIDGGSPGASSGSHGSCNTHAQGDSSESRMRRGSRSGSGNK